MTRNIPLWHKNEQSQWAIISQDVSQIEFTSDRIMEVLDINEQDQVGNNQNRLNELLIGLRQEIGRISSEYNFNYKPEIYNYRLLRVDGIYQKLLDKILSSNKELNQIFTGILELFDNEQIREVMRQSIIIEYLSDLILETMQLNEVWWAEHISFKNIWEAFIEADNCSKNRCTRTVYFWVDSSSVFRNKPDDYLEFIKRLGKAWITEMNIDYLHFIFTENTSKLLQFFKIAWENWIYKLNITLDIAALHFIKWKNILPDIIDISNKSWILHLDFHGNNILLSSIYSWYTTFSTNSIATIFAKVWQSNLKHFWLWGNILWNFYNWNPIWFIKVILSACNNWLKSLDLSYNNLFEIFENKQELFIDFISVIWKHWIKFLNISSTDFWRIFDNNSQYVLEFIKAVWTSWIRSINISDDDFLSAIFMDNPDFLVDFIKSAWDSWIKSLDMKNLEIAKFSKEFIDVSIKALEILLNSWIMYANLQGFVPEWKYHRLPKIKQDTINSLIENFKDKRKIVKLFT